MNTTEKEKAVTVRTSWKDHTNAAMEITPMPDPSKDQIEFINIDSVAAGELGKMLTHFAHMPFVHPRFGPFQCLEGFWYWIKSKERPDELRYATGSVSRKIGRGLTKQYCDNFHDFIMEANYCRINQNPEFKEKFLKSSLPFEMYYFFPDPEAVDRMPVRPAAHRWLCLMFEHIREMMWNGEEPNWIIPAPKEKTDT